MSRRHQALFLSLRPDFMSWLPDFMPRLGANTVWLAKELRFLYFNLQANLAYNIEIDGYT